MKIKPLSLKTANKFVLEHHRHHGPVVGHKFAIGLINAEGELKGVAICSRPVSRRMDDEFTLEVSRLCVSEAPNACSMLYAACARTAKGMGYTKIITYILKSETGTSLKAAGWAMDAQVRSDVWNSSGTVVRTHTVTDLFGSKDKYPAELKTRWVKLL